jgi:hypothetical protein
MQSPGAPGDTAMLRVVANGYYAWRYGNDAIGEPR